MKVIEHTTVGELPNRIKELNLPEQTPIRVIIQEEQPWPRARIKKIRLPFLDVEAWDSEDTPSDLSTNIDHYVYDR